ncbi:hypothetical protein L9F63_009796, partial [Diploptera punctata]
MCVIHINSTIKYNSLRFIQISSHLNLPNDGCLYKCPYRTVGQMFCLCNYNIVFFLFCYPYVHNQVAITNINFATFFDLRKTWLSLCLLLAAATAAMMIMDKIWKRSSDGTLWIIIKNICFQ